jgi:hypothetical protein
MKPRFSGRLRQASPPFCSILAPMCLTSTPHLTPVRQKAQEKGSFTMTTGPKDNQLKMERILNAWETLAPSKTFGGMTLQQFQAAAQPAQAARERVDEIEDQRTQAITAREQADDAFFAKAQLVVAGVLADPTEGADSALYEAMGYTRKSDRKSGLTRKRKTPTPTK